MSASADCRKFSNFFGAVGRLVDRLKARWRQETSPDRYRPEKHYMRGPGPKSAGKPDNSNSTVA
jgi:hypothetical protein